METPARDAPDAVAWLLALLEERRGEHSGRERVGSPSRNHTGWVPALVLLRCQGRACQLQKDLDGISGSSWRWLGLGGGGELEFECEPSHLLL